MTHQLYIYMSSPYSLIYGDVCTLKAHMSARNANNFNFHKYIQRSLDEDLRVVVSVRCYHKLTIFVLFFALKNS